MSRSVSLTAVVVGGGSTTVVPAKTDVARRICGWNIEITPPATVSTGYTVAVKAGTTFIETLAANIGATAQKRWQRDGLAIDVLPGVAITIDIGQAPGGESYLVTGSLQYD